MIFHKPKHLPSLMVAPNGARPMKKDHPEVPITVAEIVKTGKACFDSGADAIHFHMRDKNGKHVLYKRTPSCGCIKFNNQVIESQIKLAGGFKSGWCELDNYWVLDTNQKSNELKKLCQIGYD